MGDTEITFPAEIIKVQTMVDYGIRLTLDLPENCVMQAAQLMECKRAQGVQLQVTIKVGEVEDEIARLIRNDR